MNRSDAELSDIVPFKEDGLWYFKLIYKYEDKKGKHTVVIPKAAIPFDQRCLPSINRLDPYYRFLLERPYISCNDSIPLYESVCDLTIAQGAKEPGYYFDIITEYASREMTLDEIEKELGYKVKIINKKNDLMTFNDIRQAAGLEPIKESNKSFIQSYFEKGSNDETGDL